MKILLVEDDAEAAAYIVKGLREMNHVVDSVVNGEECLYLAGNHSYDVLVVDRMLPDGDGLQVIRELRASGMTIPVLVLSALGDTEDRVTGLRAGADDYLPKPYAFSELIARLEALARRRFISLSVEDKLVVDDLELDLRRYRVTRGGKQIDLKPREFKLLEYLMRHAGQVVTRTMVIEAVWDYNFDPQTNVIDVHISRLRAKVDKGFGKELIKTVRGLGYKIG